MLTECELALFKSLLLQAQHKAKLNQVCLRKAVGGLIMYPQYINQDDRVWKKLCEGYNGPAAGSVCSNEIGNCGCGHVEPRLIIEALKLIDPEISFDLVMIVQYSPCTNCANIIVDSGIIKHVVFEIITEHDKRGMDILSNNDITLTQLK